MKETHNCFHAAAQNFSKIPGSPVAYWVNEKTIKAFDGQKLGDVAEIKHGMSTGNNAVMLRLWHEVSRVDLNVNAMSHEVARSSSQKWFPYNKGGEFRRWFGNADYVIRYDEVGKNLLSSFSGFRHDGRDFYFKEGITWSFVSSGTFAARYTPIGFLFDVGGSSLFTKRIYFVLGFLCSSLSYQLLKIINPTINFQVGNLKVLPLPQVGADEVESYVTDLIALSRSDWDEYEISWDFKVNPLVREGWQKGAGGMTLEAAWAAVFARRMEWAARMKELEEENNRLFIEAYGLEDELKPDVAWKDVSITGNPFYRYKVDGEMDAARRDASSLHGVPEELEAKARADAMRELISYGMGILMGRYSLEQEGLILASQGETYQDYLSRVHGVDKIRPDDDGIIPAIALDGDIFSDNLLHRMREFLSAAFGNDVLPANLNFIEAALDCKFDKYLMERFFDDHVKTYRKRPIYWLFESPKGYFRAFAYMHRMTGATAGLIRNKYLLPYIAHLEKCLASESAKGSAMTAFERKRVKEIEKAIADCKKYDLTLHDIAGRSIAIDLDDGVVVNWEKYKSVLARM